MRIIFDIHHSQQTFLSASGEFLTELIEEIAARYSHHSFVYLVDKSFSQITPLPDNISIHPINRVLAKWFGKKFWYINVLGKEIKKLKGDLYVTADNIHTSKPGVPLALFLLHAAEILQNEAPAKKNPGYKKFANAIRKAAVVISFSKNDQQLIQSQVPKSEVDLKLLMPSPVETSELKWTEKEMVKIDVAGGMEYFVFAGDLHHRYDLIGLLKAFSLFKKWQQSNMRLVIAGNKTKWTSKFTSELATFKYRNEVNVIVNPSKEKVQKIIAGAYAFVYPASYDNFPVNILQAIQAGVPVISSPIRVCKEWCGDTVMYPESNDAGGFAKSLQMIYKDERTRSDFIEAAKKRLSLHSRSDLVEKCMIFLEEAIAK